MRIRWRGLELPTRVMRDDAASTATYGRFIVEPFERGFGTTVGNSLRRILLSSLQGAAVSHVRIKGADHEFMTLPGVYEDVAEIILNVKSLITKSTAEEPKTIRLAVKGKKGVTVPVTAADIVCDPHIEIVNTGQLLLTLTDEVEFEMDMTVGVGRGYVTADENKPQDQDQVIGVIPVDSVFSPVTRVRYRVEDTRVGQRVNYDRLVMEIWTNGTVLPEMGLVEAAKILRKHLNPFVQYFELGVGLAVEGVTPGDAAAGPAGGAAGDPSSMAQPIPSLDLSVRSSNCLASANITTIGQLLELDEVSLLKLRSFGRTSLREVKQKLADRGLSLKSSPPGEEVDEIELEEHAGNDEEEQMNSGPGGFSVGPTSAASRIAPLDSGSMNPLSPLDSGASSGASGSGDASEEASGVGSARDERR